MHFINQSFSCEISPVKWGLLPNTWKHFLWPAYQKSRDSVIQSAAEGNSGNVAKWFLVVWRVCEDLKLHIEQLDINRAAPCMYCEHVEHTQTPTGQPRHVNSQQTASQRHTHIDIYQK